MIQIDQGKILQAVMECQVANPSSRETGVGLIEEYISRLEKFPDTHIPTYAVEALWYIRLDTNTYIVGATDRILDDDHHTLCEWKTRRPPKVKKDGTPYKGDSEDDWLEELGKGVQPRVYALAARDGHFFINGKWEMLDERYPQVLIRAVLKSTPPDIWPSDTSKGLFKFTDTELADTRAALIVKGEQIRAARKVACIPWQIPGNQCKLWNRVCQHYERGCSKGNHPEIEMDWSTSTDPGVGVARMLNLDSNDPEIVVLSQSGYQTATECMEKFRRGYMTRHGEGEDSEALDVGSVYHAGLAEVYRQLKGVQV